MADVNTSYTGRDFTEIRQQLNNFIPYLTDLWKDHTESDPGETLIELLAGIQDYQNFYLDNQAFETYLDSAQQDKNIRSLLRAMNYRIPAIVSAKGEISVKFDNPVPVDIVDGYFTIPKYTVVTNKTNNKISYLTTDTTMIPVDEDSATVSVIEGTLRTMTITRKILEKNLTLSGDVSRRIYLTGGDSSNYADHSVEITQKDVIWTEVDDAIVEYNGGPLYSVHQDSNGEYYILMSVNFLDYIPVNPEEEVTITWIQSSGTSGLVNRYVLDTFSKFTDWNNKSITVTNKNKTYGASDVPDLISLKPLARRQAQTLGRYITIDDYKNGVDTEPYVSQSVVKDWKSRKYVDAPYIVKVWAVDSSNQDLGTQDIKSLRNKLMSKGTTDIDVQYIPTSFVKIRMDIDLEVMVSTTSNMKTLENLVIGYLDEMYSLGNLSYAYKISIVNLISGIRSVSSYIKTADVTLYTGTTTSLNSYSGYDITEMSQSLKDLEDELTAEGKTEPTKDKKYRVLLDSYIETIKEALADIPNTEIERYDEDSVDYLNELNVITWSVSGDISLDEIEFPVMYCHNVSSHIEGEGYDL